MLHGLVAGGGGVGVGCPSICQEAHMAAADKDLTIVVSLFFLFLWVCKHV